MTTATVFLTNTAATTWTVPANFGSLVSIEAIGEGGSGGSGVSGAGGGDGGGSGEYRKITSATNIVAGNVLTIAIGAGGTGTPTSLKDNTSTVIIKAFHGLTGGDAGGGGNTGGSGGTGAAANFSGASGGSGAAGAAVNCGGGGGAGAAGPTGAGKAGGTSTSVGGSGGGGSNGGSSTVGASSSSITGAAGGNNTAGSGAGAAGTASANPGNGTAGGGGGGDGNFSGNGGGTGSMDTSTAWGASFGPAGGGGGGDGATFSQGGFAVGYGAGGGGGGAQKPASGGGQGSGGNGSQGIIVIIYNILTATLTTGSPSASRPTAAGGMTGVITWYCNYGNGSTTGYYAVAQWAATHAYSIGNIVRQLAAPAVGNERCFRCTTAGTSLGTEPTWVLTKGSTTTETAGPVWTEVTGNGSYNWSAPHARIKNASLWMAAGDDLYVGDNHAETQTTAITINPLPGTAAAPNRIICVNHSGSVPPVSADLRTTASLSVTTAATTIQIEGFSYFYGLNFIANTSTVYFVMNNGGRRQNFDSCNFYYLTTSGGFGASNFGETILNNCALIPGATTSSIYFGQNIIWKGSNSSVSGSIPTNFIGGSGSGNYYVIIDGIDLSPFASSTLFNNAGNGKMTYQFINCKLNASVTLSAALQYSAGPRLYNLSSDSTSSNYRNEIYDSAGTMTSNTTIVRSGGASDGTTPISWKVATNANNFQVSPFSLFEIGTWIDTTNAVRSATFEVVCNANTLTNADVWCEAYYIANSASPQSSIATSGLADPLATNSALTASTVTWTTTGIATPIKQNMTVSFTNQMKGYVRFKIKVAKPSTTIWVDPKPTIT